MKRLRTKIPPPLIVLFYCALAWALAKYFDPLTVNVVGVCQLARVLAILTSSVGIIVAAYALFSFHRVGTTHSPLSPQLSSSLVTRGVYRYTRNPMYLGLLMMLAGVTLYLCNIVAVIVIPLFITTLNYLQIEPEEEALQAVFGDEYLKYMKEVRRWL